MIPESSGEALDLVLKEGGEIADAIKGRFEKTTLWRFRKSRQVPRADDAAWLETLTGGRVAANGWAKVPDPKDGRAA